MLQGNRIGSNTSKIYRLYYQSPENGLKIKVIRYKPIQILKKINTRANISKFITPYLYDKMNKVAKRGVLGNYNIAYTHLLEVYFDWVIREVIKGNIVKLFGSSELIVKMQIYSPTNVERIRTKQFITTPKFGRLREDVGKPMEDFKLNRYRIAIYRLDENGEYNYHNYFLKIHDRYKKLIKEQIKNNPDVYVRNITI